jgi:hypothetical protein
MDHATKPLSAARKGRIGHPPLASLKGLKRTDGIPEEFGRGPAHELRPMADASSMVKRLARRLNAETRATRRAADLPSASAPIGRRVQASRPRISRLEVREMVSRSIAEELTTISAPAPTVHRSELRRQIDAQVAREATPSTQQGGGGTTANDVEDAFKRMVRRIFKEEQIRTERDLTPFG